MADLSTLKPFSISVSDAELSRLKDTLALTRFPDEITVPDNAWAYGVPLAEMERLTEYWKTGYDWRKHETLLNSTLPQFTIDVPIEGFETLSVHFVHQKSTSESAIPLLFIHGWPGCFLEVAKILPMLTGVPPDGGQSFHVVAVSLPGYAFSQGTSKKGMTIMQFAEVCHKVMQALGYERYVAQGGDIGSSVSRRLADLYGETHVRAIHCNMISVGAPSLLRNPLAYLWTLFGNWTMSEREKAQMERTARFRKIGSGYSEMHSTRPQTLGYSLADSPVGLLAWIYEKLHEWSDDYPWEDDEILTWVSIYWFSRAGPTASIRIYYESKLAIATTPLAPTIQKNVLVGYSWFPKEIIASPPVWAHTTGKVVFEGLHDRGGHFAAHEVPEALVSDLRKMFGKGGGAYNVLNGV